MTGYRGAWLYGSEHVQVFVGRLKAEWEQFCPVPADVRDGILMRGNVLYRQSSGGWSKSGDQFEGVLRTEHGRGGLRYFVGKTQHTFRGSQLPNGQLTVIAKLEIPLSHKAPNNPLVSVPGGGGGGEDGGGGGGGGSQGYAYNQNTYTSPTLSYPTYESSQNGGEY